MEWLLGALPIALIALICPLLMIIMMRGMHGGHGRSSTDATQRDLPQDRASERLRELEVEVADLKWRLAGRRFEPVDGDEARTQTHRLEE